MVGYKDPEKQREYNRAWRAKNAEKHREYSRAWRAKNLERAREHDRGRYAKNPERGRGYSQAWRLKNPEKLRELSRRRQGIEGATGEQRIGRCPICPPGSPEVTLVCDHEHREPDGSGPIRGWLCRRCNRGLGMLGDDADGVKRALAYLTGGLG